MNSKLLLIFRGLVVIARDMFVGFLLGICAAVLFARVSPGSHAVVGLLIPAGTAAGICKGLAKFISLQFSSFLPSKGYRFEYPKFKILLLWVLILVVVLVLSYGLNPLSWVKETLGLLTGNILFSNVSLGMWIALVILMTLIGIAAHVYDPPFNEAETLPVEPDEESLPEDANNLSQAENSSAD